MKQRSIKCLSGVGLLATVAVLIVPAAGPPFAQTAAPGEYYEICRRLGFIPGTTPMRRCIQIQRDTDLDPLSALSEYKLAPDQSPSPALPEDRLDGNFSGAESAKKLLESSPEELLLGPDFRPNSQGVYE